MKILLFVFTLISSLAFSQEQPSTLWSADVAHSNLGFKVKHKAISYTVGDFRDFDLSINSATDNFENAEIKMVIKTASINTANDSRDQHLRGADFFDAEKYPEIVFKSKKVTKNKDNTYAVLGDLDLHGVTKEITLSMTHNGTSKTRKGNELVGLYFSTTFKRSDFLIGKDMPVTVVADEIDLNAEIEIVK